MSEPLSNALLTEEQITSKEPIPGFFADAEGNIHRGVPVVLTLEPETTGFLDLGDLTVYPTTDSTGSDPSSESTTES